MSTVRNFHHCSEHYKLRSYRTPFSCHGCKTTGFGERYCCRLCELQLHKECGFPKRTMEHEFFGCSTFTFRSKPFTRYVGHRREYSKLCDACGKSIRGYSYHCERDNLDLHPSCLRLRKKVLISEDTMLKLKANIASKCMWCKKRAISDDARGALGWSYVSTCNKYHFHVYCMTEMMYETCMKSREMGLKKVEHRKLVSHGVTNRKVFGTIKAILKVILSVLIGDPTLLISSGVVEAVDFLARRLLQ